MNTFRVVPLCAILDSEDSMTHSTGDLDARQVYERLAAGCDRQGDTQAETGEPPLSSPAN